MSEPRKIYWDSSCFICFLNKDERERRLVCEDVLQHASAGDVEIWYSMWAIVEVIRPKRPGNAPLPEWARKAITAVPEAQKHLEELWSKYQRASPSQKLTPKQIAKIQGMFQWPFLKPVYIEQRVADKAVEIARDTGLKPGDAIHAAAAITAKCSVIQRWDRDYSKVSALIPSEEPEWISPQGALEFTETIGPTPEDLEDEEQKTPKTKSPAANVEAPVDGRSGGGSAKDETAGIGSAKAEQQEQEPEVKADGPREQSAPAKS